MVRDKRARRSGKITVTALANIIAAVTDTMIFADMPNHVVRHFIDELDDLNGMTLDSHAGRFLAGLCEILRQRLPDND